MTSRTRGLRFRVTAAFALGALLLFGILGSSVYLFSYHYLVEQRERSLVGQAYADARVVRDTLARSDEVKEPLAILDRVPGSNAVVRWRGRWFGTTVASAGATVPDGLRRLVEAGSPAHQRIDRSGVPTFVVGVPVDEVGAEYYEMFSLLELDRTLRTIRNALMAGGALAVVMAGLIGWTLSRRVLRPVADFASAAERVAAGDLETRLAPGADPDLASLAASFNHMVDAVERRIARESRFVADASHELRSPLTTLATAVEVMEARRDELPDRARRAFDLLRDEVRLLQRLVEDLLELGAAEAGAEAGAAEPVRLDELVANVVARSAGAQAVTVDVDPCFGEPVLADKRRFERILSNLIVNAGTHGRGLERLSLERRGDRLRLEVVDGGPGVPDDERQAVFERFFRGAAAGRRASSTGSGLGLALVAEHVRRNGGRVWVEDRDDGAGARFVVELPWAGEPGTGNARPEVRA